MLIPEPAAAWDTSCKDWKQRLLAGGSLVPDLPLFDREAELALEVFKKLRLPDVIGTPRLGDVFGQWTFDLVRAVFGAYDPVARRRMISEFFLLIAKKNGKSTIAAAIMLTALIRNRRPKAEGLLIAPTKEIADISFGQAEGMILLDPGLKKLFHIQRHIRKITHRTSNATLQIKAADTDVITGGKQTYTLIDETHEFARKANAAQVFVEIRGALAARPDGFLLQITTQSKEPPVGQFKQELAVARDIRDGLIRLPRLPILYELPLEMARDGGWKDEKTWPLVNPNIDRSVDRTFLRNALLAAERDPDPRAAEALLASQHFNVEVGMALRNDAWAGARYWEGAADTQITLERMCDECEVIVVGVDGGGLDDLLGAAALGRHKRTKDWWLWNHAWAQSDVFERRKQIDSTLRDFVDEGSLTLCEDPTQDVREVADLCERIRDAGLLPEENGVGLDPMGVAAIVDELAGRGIKDKQVVGISQGYRLSGAVWGMERKLKDGTLWHAGQKLMTWCVGNAKIEQRGNAVLVTKQVAGRAKIDPLVASFDATMLMSRNPQASRKDYQMMFV